MTRAKSLRLVRLDATGQPIDTETVLPTPLTFEPSKDAYGDRLLGSARITEQTITIHQPNIETLALLFGTSVVDASILFEPHLVRGEQ